MTNHRENRRRQGISNGSTTMSMLLYMTGLCSRSNPTIRKSAAAGAVVQGQRRLGKSISLAHCWLSNSSCKREG